MIEVDVFWSFAMGAAFAGSGFIGIQQAKSIFINKYFVYTVCFLSMIFAPSGVYLLWQHTAWETMFFLDRSMHGIWPMLFAHTNVSLGVLGFVLTSWIIKQNWMSVVPYMWTTPYVIMFSILTFGYDRFLYPGSEEEFKNKVHYDIPWDFFHCEVFKALMVMSIFVLPPLLYAAIYWPSESGIDTDTKWRTVIGPSFFAYLYLSIIVSAIYMIALRLGFTPENWGFDRLAAFGIGQVAFGSLLFVPLLFIQGKNQVKTSEKKSKKKKSKYH